MNKKVYDLRFVIEVDPRLTMPCETEQLQNMVKSLGMKKALLVPGRMLEMMYYGGFSNGIGNDAYYREQRGEWGAYLVPSTHESRGLLKALREAKIVSLKISPSVGGSIEIKIVFRRNRETLGYIDMSFNLEGKAGCSCSDLTA